MIHTFQGVLTIPHNIPRFDYCVENDIKHGGDRSNISDLLWKIYKKSETCKILIEVSVLLNSQFTGKSLEAQGSLFLRQIFSKIYGWAVDKGKNQSKSMIVDLDTFLFENIGRDVFIEIDDYDFE